MTVNSWWYRSIAIKGYYTTLRMPDDNGYL